MVPHELRRPALHARLILAFQTGTAGRLRALIGVRERAEHRSRSWARCRLFRTNVIIEIILVMLDTPQNDGTITANSEHQTVSGALASRLAVLGQRRGQRSVLFYLALSSRLAFLTCAGFTRTTLAFRPPPDHGSGGWGSNPSRRAQRPRSTAWGWLLCLPPDHPVIILGPWGG